MTEGIFQSKDIESAVLGICLLEKTAFGRTVNLVDTETFYTNDNQAIYSTMREMFDQSVPIDLLTVWEKIISSGTEFTCMKNDPNPSGALSYYLTSLTNNVVSSAHLEYHCHLLKKMWRKRELERLTNSSFDYNQDEKQQIYLINQQLNDILGSEVKKDWKTMDELMYDLMIHQNDIATGKKVFVTTGFKAIDQANGGFSGGQLIVVGARPAMGKSALMNKMAVAAAKDGKKVGVISLEMNNVEIAARFASLETEIEFWRIHRNLFIDEQQRNQFYDKISKKTINLPIYVSDKTKVDVLEIKAKAAKLKHAHGIDLLIIDYLQLIDSSVSNKNYNREQEVAKISRGLKLLANDFDIPVIALCQLNRESVKRKGDGRYPQPSDLRESGSLEQDADVIMMLHRDWEFGLTANEHGLSTERDADLLGVKWRNGAKFHLKMDFDPEKMKFSEMPGFKNVAPVQERNDEEEPF